MQNKALAESKFRETGDITDFENELQQVAPSQKYLSFSYKLLSTDLSVFTVHFILTDK